ncbi:MerR family transcriptional regulator [Arenivirga flava]|uniref:HTH merR-type domain-containing protein n=1 Tax=Arenivirga flava TaxID=1930060 RepID=A0AA37XBJ3_9MICO|nr:MerR family transcriptional regulator [Arenivirga flava]GMA28756.1 hypothetical protein GCM10025874_20090 [Arenivirga flava]
MRIGELATLSGVSVRALRYYEEQGLLAPARSASGQRIFGEGDRAEVLRIRALLAAGFCSSVIRGLLPAYRDGGTERIRSAIAAARARLETERRAIDAELDALAGLERELAPDVGVRVHAGRHAAIECSEAVAPDHRDRRLR